MKRFLLTLLLFAVAATPGLAQVGTPTLYISPTHDSFEVYLTAAMHKKDVPVHVTTNAEGPVYAQDGGTPNLKRKRGWKDCSLPVRLLFRDCGFREHVRDPRASGWDCGVVVFRQ